ncbi:MAG TPA: hypothetical protein PK522_00985, partial [Nitrosomonas sp.]|nr:hypothetical protein [Nitrosomonas sp.]
MALMTRAKFYFGIEVEQDNNLIDIDEGSGEVSIEIPVGSYSPKQFSEKLSAVLTSSLTQT